MTAGCAGTAQEATGPPAVEARVGLSEVTTSAPVLANGPVTVQVTNDGTTEHDLVLSAGRSRIRTPLLSPGGQASLEVGLARARELVLWCGVPGHRGQGMEAVLPVARQPDDGQGREAGPRSASEAA